MKKKVEEVVEEVEKSKVSIGKIFLCTLFVLFALIGIFFLSTYIRWKAEISDKVPILYTGQEEVKIDKLVDFYSIELSPVLKENEALYVYCTSEYGKECILTDYNNVLENNFRNPLLVISIIVLIDLIIVYILTKENLNGKKRTYVYGAIIILWGLVNVCIAVYKVADYYKEIKFNKTIDANVVYYLRTDSEKKYIPVYKYLVEENEKYYIPTDYAIKGEFKAEEATLYYEDNDYNLITVKKDMKKYILPASVGFVTIIVGFVYLTINSRFKKKQLKEEEEKKKGLN